MIKVLIGAAEQSIASDLRTAIGEMDSIESVFVAESTQDLIAAVLRMDPDVVLVHDQLGPDPVLQMIRDLSLRRLGCAALVVSVNPPAELFAAAMDAGARGVVSYPPAFEDLQSRLLAAGDWAQQMRRLMAGARPIDGVTTDSGRARVITFCGAKGGVGTTTIATHIALDVVRTVPGHRVCLIDLDLEKGDVSGILEVRHRASIADVAKVSEDLSAQAIGDAVVVHESGLRLLLAPSDVREVEAVDPRSLREVIAVLGREYDLVVIDAGAHVTPLQATVVELADEVLLVTTPDVLALRGLRRTVTQWEGLGVRKETDLHVLLNRVSRQGSVSPEMVRQLTRAPVLQDGLPAMFRRLEPALNTRDPLSLREDDWWAKLRAIGIEVGLVRSTGAAAGPAAGPAAASSSRSGSRAGTRAGARASAGAGAGAGAATGTRSRRRSFGRGDSGQATLETVGILPVLILACLLVWQLGVAGMTFVWSGHAADAASRALSVRADPVAAARQAVPDSVASSLSVSSSGNVVTVSVRVPIGPGLGAFPGAITTSRTVVLEP